MNNKNMMFRGLVDERGKANACVGNNGSPGAQDYAKGFSLAANKLIDVVLTDNGVDFPFDDMVYPVCFTMRHSVELRLKVAVEKLIELSKCRKTHLKFDLDSSHDIGRIWRFFRVESEKFDRRYKEFNAKLDPLIADVASIDPSGQTFRYPMNSRGKKHLESVASINFYLLKEKFLDLERILDKLYSLGVDLLYEYRFGVFTNNLSRFDILEIAKKLPEHSR